jgi:hypothetical protein
MFFFLCFVGPSLLLAIAGSKSIDYNIENYQIGNVTNANIAEMDPFQVETKIDVIGIIPGYILWLDEEERTQK